MQLRCPAHTPRIFSSTHTHRGPGSTPDARDVTRRRHTRAAPQVREHQTAHQELVLPKAQQSGLIAVQMDPEQETSNAFAMRTQPCQMFPDPLSILYFDHVNGHGEIYVLNMSKRAEVIPS